MPDKNDDIKQLFAHLGLNPNDYQEIRSAPTANLTVSEPPRRWSLLQGAPKPAEPLPVAAGPAPMPAAAPARLPDALGAALQSNPAPSQPVTAPAPSIPISMELPEPTALPPLVQPDAVPAMAASSMDGLHSLFQSIKEPQTVTTPPPAGSAAQELRTERHPGPASGDMPRTEAGVIPASAFEPVPPTDYPDEPVTRFAPPPARRAASPKPQMAPQVPAPPSVQGLSFAERASAAGQALPPTPVRVERRSPEGRLRLSLGAAAGAESKPSNESLQDVFSRLAGARHG